MKKLWYDTKLCQFMYGMFFPDRHNEDWHKDVLSKIDPREMVNALKRAGVEVFYFYSRDPYGNCYNNTKVDYKHSALGKRDLFGELVKECKKAKIIPATTYEPFAAGRVGRENPGWCSTWPDGHPTTELDTPRTCIHTPMRNHILSHIEEIASNYEIEGFFSDMVLYEDCYCDNCNAEFKKKFGKTLPKYKNWEDPLWKQCIKWRYEETYKFLEEMRGILKKARPQIMFTHNFYGGPLCYWRHKQDIRTSLLDDCVELDIFIQESGSIIYTQEPRLFRSISKHRPCILMEGVCVPPRYITKPDAMFMIGAMSFISHGCSFMVGDFPYPDGTFNKELLNKVKKVNREIKSRKEWLIDCKSVKYIGLYYSRNSVDFFGKNQPGLVESSFRGALKALVEMHVPFDIITELNLEKNEIADYKVIYLPNVTCLSEKEISLLKGYVKKGGNIIASFLTSTMDETGEQQNGFALGDVLGIKLSEITDEDFSYIHFDRSERFIKDRVLLLDKQIRVNHLSGAKCRGRIQKIHQAGEHVKGAPGEITPWPAMVLNNYGKGRSLYFAGNVEREYLRNSLPALRDLIHNGIKLVSRPKPPVSAKGPISLEIEAYWQSSPRRLIIHLLNFQSNPAIISAIKSDLAGEKYFQGFTGDLIDEVLPVYDIKVTVNAVKPGDIKDVYMVPERKRLKYEVKKDGLEINIPELKIHSIIAIELKNELNSK